MGVSNAQSLEDADDKGNDHPYHSDVQRLRDANAFGPEDSIIAYGSREEGFGNPKSDIDLFIVFDGTVKHGLGGWLRDGCIVEIRRYARSYIERIAARINSATKDDLAGIAALAPTAFDEYYRMAHGVVLHGGAGVADLRKSLVPSHIAHAFALFAGLRGLAALSEAVMYLNAGNNRSAFRSARAACEWAIDSFLAEHGESFPSRKWRFEKIARRFGRTSELYRRAWDMKSLGHRDEAHYLEEATRICRELGIGKLPQLKDETRTPIRSEDTRSFKIREGSYLVRNHQAIYQLTSGSDFTWMSINGEKNEEEISLDYSKKFKLSLDVSMEEVGRIVKMFVKEGLVRWR